MRDQHCRSIETAGCIYGDLPDTGCCAHIVDGGMQTRNNYQHDISNDDIGTIARIGTVEGEEAVTIAWDDRETTLARGPGRPRAGLCHHGAQG